MELFTNMIYRKELSQVLRPSLKDTQRNCEPDT